MSRRESRPIPLPPVPLPSHLDAGNGPLNAPLSHYSSQHVGNGNIGANGYHYHNEPPVTSSPTFHSPDTSQAQREAEYWRQGRPRQSLDLGESEMMGYPKRSDSSINSLQQPQGNARTSFSIDMTHAFDHIGSQRGQPQPPANRIRRKLPTPPIVSQETKVTSPVPPPRQRTPPPPATPMVPVVPTLPPPHTRKPVPRVPSNSVPRPLPSPVEQFIPNISVASLDGDTTVFFIDENSAWPDLDDEPPTPISKDRNFEEHRHEEVTPAKEVSLPAAGERGGMLGAVTPPRDRPSVSAVTPSRNRHSADRSRDASPRRNVDDELDDNSSGTSISEEEPRPRDSSDYFGSPLAPPGLSTSLAPSVAEDAIPPSTPGGPPIAATEAPRTATSLAASADARALAPPGSVVEHVADHHLRQDKGLTVPSSNSAAMASLGAVGGVSALTALKTASDTRQAFARAHSTASVTAIHAGREGNANGPPVETLTGPSVETLDAAPMSPPPLSAHSLPPTPNSINFLSPHDTTRGQDPAASTTSVIAIRGGTEGARSITPPYLAPGTPKETQTPPRALPVPMPNGRPSPSPSNRDRPSPSPSQRDLPPPVPAKDIRRTTSRDSRDRVPIVAHQSPGTNRAPLVLHRPSPPIHYTAPSPPAKQITSPSTPNAPDRIPGSTEVTPTIRRKPLPKDFDEHVAPPSVTPGRHDQAVGHPATRGIPGTDREPASYPTPRWDGPVEKVELKRFTSVRIDERSKSPLPAKTTTSNKGTTHLTKDAHDSLRHGSRAMSVEFKPTEKEKEEMEMMQTARDSPSLRGNLRPSMDRSSHGRPSVDFDHRGQAPPYERVSMDRPSHYERASARAGNVGDTSGRVSGLERSSTLNRANTIERLSMSDGGQTLHSSLGIENKPVRTRSRTGSAFGKAKAVVTAGAGHARKASVSITNSMNSMRNGSGTSSASNRASILTVGSTTLPPSVSMPQQTDHTPRRLNSNSIRRSGLGLFSKLKGKLGAEDKGDRERMIARYGGV